MEISQIKEQLSLAQVLSYYHLKPDKNLRLHCPFHNDKTPSLQVYYKTHTAYCFSSNCKTHGKSLDVIDFVMYKESLSKHEALEKCKQLLGNSNKTLEKVSYTKESLLNTVFTYFKNGVHNSKPAKDYLEQRNLDHTKIEVGYNSGQFHHGARKDKQLIEACVQYGLLIPSGTNSRTGGTAYSSFGKNGIVFPLKNKENKIVSLYFRSSLDKENAKHFYLKGRTGLYPNYPSREARHLILTESIIDAATLLQLEENQLLPTAYSVLATYGTNGLTEEHIEAIKQLEKLAEVIFMFDNDEAGKKATEKYAKYFNNQYPNLKITTVELPSKDVNETAQLHEAEIFKTLLENRTEFIFSNERKETPEAIPNQNQTSTQVTFLKTKKLLHQINKLIEKSGIVGEENSRLLLFIIASSYKTNSPLHAIVQGSSGSGKTHLISKIADLMPPEDVLRFTRITESSLYNWGEYDLVGKVIVIEDLDGLKEEALYAIRELISNQRLSSSVSIKDKKGNIKAIKKEVKGLFASLSATTKGEIYEDNMSRSFIIAVDESKQQSLKIIQYQNQKYAGEISKAEENKTKNFLQQIIRTLKDYEIINPYATQVQLPQEVHKIRRLNEMFQAIVKQITLINQYQRKQTSEGKIITEIEDLELATTVLFESIILKVDELDGSLRQFFEYLKKYLKNKDREFTQREIRQALNISKSQLQRYINSLLELEYIRQSGGYINKGLKYKVDYWDDFERMRIRIKDHLLNQIDTLKNYKK